MKPGDVIPAALTLWRTFGARGAWHRARLIGRSGAGLYRAAPAPVPAAAVASSPPREWPFRVEAARVRATTDHARARERANRVIAGEHEAYRWTWAPRPAAAEAWSVNPLTGRRYPDVPWFKVPHYQPGVGDIKAVWEASRFAWAYDLMRAWMIDRDERAAEVFWTDLETFLDGTPPFRGVQWACGQETAIRAMAWLWAECAFADAPASTPARLARLRTVLAWAGERILDGHDWAASQRNNHGISEAAGLIALGARFHDADPRARGWLERGQALLERYIDDQLAPDGWFIQHSFTYARLALDQIVLAQRVLHSRGESLGARATERVRATIRLLIEVMDPATGHVPLHGANDGAFVLPLTTAPYRDFRPSLTAAASTFGEPLPRSVSADAEVLAWLGAGDVMRTDDPEVPRLRTGASGWAHAVTQGARLFARAGAYRSRPGHVDPLHVDIWLDGEPVAVDAGTYRYNDAPPWNNGLADATVHNTLSIEGHPAAVRGPRFLWLQWPAARIREASLAANGTIRIVMENLSWRSRRWRHTRECIVGSQDVTVIDELHAPASAPLTATVQWLLDGPREALRVEPVTGADVVESSGDPRSTLGWISEGYGSRRPARSVRVIGAVAGGRFAVVSRFESIAGRAARQEEAEWAESST